MNYLFRYVLFLQLLVIILSQSSCSPPAYIPNKIHAPLFNKQGQIYAEGSIGDSYQTDAALGYSITNDLALIGSMDVSRKDHGDSSGYSTQFFEVGAGYFHLLSPHFIFESFGTFGWGKTDSKGFNTLNKPFVLFSDYGNAFNVDTFMNISSRYVRYSVEGHIAASTSSYTLAASDFRFALEVGLALRLSYLHFISLQQQRTYSNLFAPSNISTRENDFFPDLSALIRLNFNKVILEWQVGFTGAGDNIYNSFPYITTIGLILKL